MTDRPQSFSGFGAALMKHSRDFGIEGRVRNPIPRGKNMKAKNVLVATAAAMLLITGVVTAHADDLSMSGGKQMCFGVNDCKGKSACKSVQNDCKGKNACKGQGNTATTAEDCKAKGGKMVEASK
jgi:uncharacterized membrane protein